MLNLINDQKKLANPLKCLLAGVWATTVGENPKWSKAPKESYKVPVCCVLPNIKN